MRTALLQAAVQYRNYHKFAADPAITGQTNKHRIAIATWHFASFSVHQLPENDTFGGKLAVERRNFANRGRDSQTARQGPLPPIKAIRVFINDETRFLKLCDWHFDLHPLRIGQSTATPGAVIAQNPNGNIQAVRWNVTPKQFLFHAIGSRTRTVTRPVTRAWHFQYPGRKLEANAVSAIRRNDSAVVTRRFANLKMPAFAIDRTPSGYSELVVPGGAS